MSLKRFYGYTGLVSAKTTGRLFFLFDLLIWLWTLVYEVLLKLGICKPPEPVDWDGLMDTIEELDAEEMKRDIRRKKNEKRVCNSNRRKSSGV